MPRARGEEDLRQFRIEKYIYIMVVADTACEAAPVAPANKKKKTAAAKKPKATKPKAAAKGGKAKAANKP